MVALRVSFSEVTKKKKKSRVLVHRAFRNYSRPVPAEHHIVTSIVYRESIKCRIYESNETLLTVELRIQSLSEDEQDNSCSVEGGRGGRGGGREIIRMHTPRG